MKNLRQREGTALGRGHQEVGWEAHAQVQGHRSLTVGTETSAERQTNKQLICAIMGHIFLTNISLGKNPKV